MGQESSAQIQTPRIPNNSMGKILVKIPFSQLPKKATFNYIEPKGANQDLIQDYLESIKTFRQLGFLSEENYDEGKFSLQTLSCYKSIKQIKVKWNSFIKMKEKSYLEDYEIVKNVIGKGGFGVVRKVKSKYTQQLRVAKVVRKKLMKQDDVTKLFTELFIMKMLDHPNIIKLFEVYDYQEEFVLIIEMCTGGEVYSKTKKKKLSQKKAGLIIKQILRSLIYMHNQKIVHRDIKPQNILFQNEEQKVVKMIDFGIAKKLQNNSFLQERMGTPSYIAPQVIYKKYNQKCDIWATGVSFYQFLSGRTPFNAENDVQLMREILRSDVNYEGSIWEKISEGCKQVIKLMLKKKMQERPSAKQLFEHPFFQQIEESEGTAPITDKSNVINNIHSFRFKNKLQAVVQTFVASQLLTTQQKQVLIEVFKQFDANSDGVISTEELKQALTQKGNLTAAKVQSMMKVIDINGSGQIDYTEFLVANCDSTIQLTRERLKHVFQYFDTDRNGKITYSEVAEFLQDYESSQQEIKNIFKLVDANGDGQISQDQFIDLLIKKISSFTSIHYISPEQEAKDKENAKQNRRKSIAIQKKQNRQKARKITFEGINELALKDIQEKVPLKSKFLNSL